jgi:hypothetical protein
MLLPPEQARPRASYVEAQEAGLPHRMVTCRVHCWVRNKKGWTKASYLELPSERGQNLHNSFSQRRFDQGQAMLGQALPIFATVR